MAVVPLVGGGSNEKQESASSDASGHRFSTAGEWAISFYATGIVLALFLLITPELHHWFVAPVFLCGGILGTEVIRVLRGKVDVLDPQSLVAIVGYHMFFLAPLLHVRWNSWMQFIVPPEDWRPWLGYFAWLNVLGLSLYLLSKWWVLRKDRMSASLWSNRLDHSTFGTLLFALLCTTFVLQAAIYASFGGFTGYVAAFESGTAFQGLGALFFFSESFPMLAFMGFVVWAARRHYKVGWPTIVVALLLFIALRVVFGGLRGSRASLIWSGYWALGMVHLIIRPIQKRLLVLLAVIAIAFMYIYGFYKTVGSDILGLITQPGGLETLQETTGRSFEVVLLGDLGRADVQAFLIHQLSESGRNLPYVFPWGQTYLQALTVPIPQELLPVQFSSKVDVGTYVLQAGSKSILGDQRESRVYGLAGEALLNFGLWAVPVAYLVFGLVIGQASRWITSIQGADSRLLIAPFVSVLAFYPLIWDADNVVVFMLQFGAVPAALVYFSSRRTRRSRE